MVDYKISKSNRHGTQDRNKNKNFRFRDDKPRSKKNRNQYDVIRKIKYGLDEEEIIEDYE